MRFSKDKRPYKDHLDLFFWEGKNKGWDAPGFFMRVKGLFVMCETSPRKASSAKFVTWCVRQFETMAPVSEWLRS